MVSNTNIDSVRWFLRLLVLGTVILALATIFDGVPSLILAFGYVLVVGALLFLIDIEATAKFNTLHWISLSIWGSIVILFGGTLLMRNRLSVEAINAFLYLINGLILLSVGIISSTMRELSAFHNLTDLLTYWKRTTRFAFLFYAIPLVVFWFAFAASLLGWEVILYSGTVDPGNPMASMMIYLIRVLFFLPACFVILGTYKTHRGLVSVVP